MEEFYPVIALLLMFAACGVVIYFMVKGMKEKAEATLFHKEETLRKFREERAERLRQATANRPPIAVNVPARPVSRTQPAPAQATTDTGSDWLTHMILIDAMNSPTGVSAGTVSWKDDTPTITPKTSWDREESYSTPSSSSSYGSSSSDDSSSRSSYSSSSSSWDSGSSSSSDSSSSSFD